MICFPPLNFTVLYKKKKQGLENAVGGNRRVAYNVSRRLPKNDWKRNGRNSLLRAAPFLLATTPGYVPNGATATPGQSTDHRGKPFSAQPAA